MATVEYPSQAGLTEDQKEVDRQVLQYVLEGIALLEKQHGPDWAEKIDLDRLNLASASACVLGQIEGDWMRGCQRLGIRHKDGLYGFSGCGLPEEVRDRYPELGNVGAVNEGGDTFFSMLQRIWMREIRDRKS